MEGTCVGSPATHEYQCSLPKKAKQGKEWSIIKEKYEDTDYYIPHEIITRYNCYEKFREILKEGEGKKGLVPFLIDADAMLDGYQVERVVIEGHSFDSLQDFLDRSQSVLSSSSLALFESFIMLNFPAFHQQVY